jgi:lysophospholipase L1-like esterase
VEVLNLGISGVTSDNWLKRSGELFALEPDVVLQYEGVNDIAWSALPGYSFAHPWRRRLRAARCLRPLVPVREADVAAALDQAVANQEQLELLCAARGVRHVAATFAAPDASSAAPGLRALLDDDVRTVWGRQANLAAFADYERLLDAYNRRVSAAAGRGSLVIADVHRALRDPRLFVDACHLTPEGIGHPRLGLREGGGRRRGRAHGAAVRAGKGLIQPHDPALDGLRSRAR